MNEIRFTDEAPTMDPDKPVRCFWYVMYKATEFMAWGGSRADDLGSTGPFEDRGLAEQDAERLVKFGHHIIALVPTVFQDGDYIEGYKPYEKPKPVRQNSRDLIDEIRMYDGVRIEPQVQLRNIEFRANRFGDQLANVFDRYLERQPAPEPVRINPGDGIEAAVKAKAENLKQRRPAYLDLPGQGKGRGMRIDQPRGIKFDPARWTGRGKR